MVSNERLGIGSVVCLFARNGLVEITGHDKIDDEDAKVGDYQGILHHRLSPDGDHIFFDERDISQVVLRTQPTTAA